jgi:hypothetical protein
VSQPPAFPAWLSLDPEGDIRRDRLRSLLDEHLFGDLGPLDSSLTWGWSPGSRWLGGVERVVSPKEVFARLTVEWPARASLVWDGWNGQRQDQPVTFDDRRLEVSPYRIRWHGNLGGSDCRLDTLTLPGEEGSFSSFNNEKPRAGADGLQLQDGEALLRAVRRSLWFAGRPLGSPEQDTRSAGYSFGNIRAIAVPGRKEGNQFILLPYLSDRKLNDEADAAWDAAKPLPYLGHRVDANGNLHLDLLLQVRGVMLGNYDVACSPDRRFLHFWQRGRNLQPGRNDPRLGPLAHATYDLQRGRWVRLVDADLNVYRPDEEKSASRPIPPEVWQCTPLGRPRVLDYCGWLGTAAQDVVLRLSPDGSRLLTIWLRWDDARLEILDGMMHVWRMPGSEVAP